MKYLRLKNWSKYQNIAGLRAEYVRFQTGILVDAEFMALPERERLCFFLLILYAGIHANKIPYDANTIMRLCWMDEEPDLELLIEHELLEDFDEVKHQQMLDKYEEKLIKDRKRKRVPPVLHSESKRNPDGRVRFSNVETETETETKTYKKHIGSSAVAEEPAPVKKRNKPKAYTEGFENIWAKKPARAGSDPKKQAFHAYNARVKDGYTDKQMAEGVDRYKLFLKATGKEGTEYVQRLSTFLGTQLSFLEAWTPPKPDVKKAGVPAEDNAAIRWGTERGIPARPGESMFDYRIRLRNAVETGAIQ